MLNKDKIYRPVKNDGANYTCTDCLEEKQFNLVWYVITPNHKQMVLCKTCVDPDWLKDATFNPKPI
jgi:hypothetical protein